MTMETVCYGIGGYLPAHPNGNVIERVVDNGDGTGTRTTYDAAGEIVATEAVNGLPVAAPDPAAEIAAARTSLLAATTVAQTKARTVALFDLLTTTGDTP